MANRFPLTGKWSAEHPYTLIDHLDVEGKGEWAGLRFRDYNWYPMRTGSRNPTPQFYVGAYVNGRSVYAHQFLTGERGMDHIDRDAFNNTSDNLRRADRNQQNANHGIQRNNTSGLIGVSWSRGHGKWGAYIKPKGKLRHLGWFDDQNEAGRMRDKAAFEQWGEYAVLNFPDEMRVAT